MIEQTETKKRNDRRYQQKHRGGKRSFVTEIENLKIILAWEAGNLSEGWAAKLIGIDRISLREMRLKLLEEVETK